MLLAEPAPLFAILIAIAIIAGLGFVALWLFRGYECLARRSLGRIYSDFDIHPDFRPGDVVVTYHTYHGLVAWFTQTPHYVALPPDDARKLLGRLLRFNLTWGLATPGLLLIPPLALMHYASQRRSIDRQEANGGTTTSAVPPADTLADDFFDFGTASKNKDVASPSLFHRVAGCIAAGLCAVCGIGTIACLVDGKFDGAIVCLVLVVLLGWVARNWLGIT